MIRGTRDTLILLLLLVLGANALAASDTQLTYSGRLYDTNGVLISGQLIKTRAYVRTTTTCYLYRRDLDRTTDADGNFSLVLETNVTGVVYASAGDMLDLLRTSYTTPIGCYDAAGALTGTNLTPSTGPIGREIVIAVSLDGGTTWDEVDIHSLRPYYQSQDSNRLGGLLPSEYLRTSASVSQTAAEALFSGSNFAALSTFSTSGSLSTSVAPSTGNSIVNKTYSDSYIAGSATTGLGTLSTTPAGSVLTWNGTSWTVAASSSVDNTKLPLTGGTISGNLLMPAGTLDTANIKGTQYLTMNPNGYLQLSNRTAAPALTAPSGYAGAMWFNTTTQRIQVLATSGTLDVLDSSGTLSVSRGGTGLSSFTPYAIMAANSTGSAIEQRTCSVGEVLQWNLGTGFQCTTVAALGGGQWSPNSAGIHYATGSVGIGTNSPASDLQVVSQSNLASVITIGPSTVASGAAKLGLKSKIGTTIYESQVSATGANLFLQPGSTGSVVVVTPANNPIATFAATGLIGFGTTSPTAMLDVVATGTVGSALRIPRDTELNRPFRGTAAELQGMMRYNTDSNKYEVYQGTTGWASLSTGAGSGTVTKIELISPSSVFLNGGTTATTTAGTFDLTLALQTQNKVLAAPLNATGAPTFRILDAADIGTGTLAAARGGSKWSYGAVGQLTSGTFNVNVNGVLSINDSAPIAALDVSHASAAQSAIRIPRDTTANRPLGWIGMMRYNTSTDKFEGYQAGVWKDLISTGTVSSVDLTVPSIFTANPSPVTSAGTLSFGLASQAAGSILAAPTGAAGVPTFRAFNATSDIGSGTVSVARGGTSMGTIATNQVLSGNAGGTGLEYRTIYGGTGVTISTGAGSIGIATPWAVDGVGANYPGRVGVGVAANSSFALTVAGPIAFSGTLAVYGTGALLRSFANNGLSLGFESLQNATGSNNTAVGNYTFRNLTTGNSNSAFGTQAGSALTSGANNIFLGANAASNTTSGSDNIIIGASLGTSTATISNEVNIGGVLYGSNASNNEKMSVFTNSTERLRVQTNGFVLVGSGADAMSTLHVHRAGNSANQIQITNGATGATTSNLGLGVGLDSSSNALINMSTGQSLSLAVGGTRRLTVASTGSVGIGTTTPGEMLEVNGVVKALSFTSTSDGRLKKNIEPISGLESLRKLRGVQYRWISSDEPDAGVIAQEVEQVFPAAVRTDAKGMKSVKYNYLIAPLIQSVKELDVRCEAQVTQLHQRIDKLEEQNAQLQKDKQLMEERLLRLERAAGLSQ